MKVPFRGWRGLALALCAAVMMLSPASGPTAQSSALAGLAPVVPNFDLGSQWTSAKVGKLVFDTAVTPRWMQSGDRFWYSYQTRDGRWIALSGASPSVFERLCRSLGVPDLPRDPRFRDNQARLANVDALDAALQTAIARFDQADLLAALDAAHAVAAPVRSTDEVLADPHYQARGSIATVADAELGPVRMQNVIGRLSGTPGRITHAGPRLGEHNRAVLVDELGFSEAELRAGGITLP